MSSDQPAVAVRGIDGSGIWFQPSHVRGRGSGGTVIWDGKITRPASMQNVRCVLKEVNDDKEIGSNEINIYNKYLKKCRVVTKCHGTHILDKNDKFKCWMLLEDGGDNLRHLRDEFNGNLTEIQIRCIIKNILNALSELSKTGVLHLDIRPENILICKAEKNNDIVNDEKNADVDEKNIYNEWNIKICDFGMAMPSSAVQNASTKRIREKLAARPKRNKHKQSIYPASWVPIDLWYQDTIDSSIYVWCVGLLICFLFGLEPNEVIKPLNDQNKPYPTQYWGIHNKNRVLPQNASPILQNTIRNCLFPDSSVRYSLPDLINNDVWINQMSAAIPLSIYKFNNLQKIDNFKKALYHCAKLADEMKAQFDNNKQQLIEISQTRWNPTLKRVTIYELCLEQANNAMNNQRETVNIPMDIDGVVLCAQPGLCHTTPKKVYGNLAAQKRFSGPLSHLRKHWNSEKHCSSVPIRCKYCCGTHKDSECKHIEKEKRKELFDSFKKSKTCNEQFESVANDFKSQQVQQPNDNKSDGEDEDEDDAKCVTTVLETDSLIIKLTKNAIKHFAIFSGYESLIIEHMKAENMNEEQIMDFRHKQFIELMDFDQDCVCAELLNRRKRELVTLLKQLQQHLKKYYCAENESDGYKHEWILKSFEEIKKTLKVEAQSALKKRKKKVQEKEVVAAIGQYKICGICKYVAFIDQTEVFECNHCGTICCQNCENGCWINEMF